MKPFSYKGYLGLVDCDEDHAFLHGKIIGISDLVTYEAETMPDGARSLGRHRSG